MIPVACNRDCGATCPLAVQAAPDGTVGLIANPLAPELKRPCPRGLRAVESRNAPDRLTVPLIRTGARGSGEFREAGWDEALDRAAGGLAGIIERHGAEAILCHGGSGACKGALHNTNALTARFLNALGPVTRMSGSYSSGAANFVKPFLFGSANPAFDTGTLLASRFVILWGFNAADTRFGNETESVLERLREREVEIVVIDPRRTRTAKLYGTRWIPIRPGSDTAAMLAVLWVLLDAGLVDREFLGRYTTGFVELEAYVLGKGDSVPKSPEWAEPLTGIPAAVLRDLALRYGRTKPAALLPGLSIQRTVGGEEAVRMAVALQAATGNTGIPGGSSGRYSWGGLPGPRCPSIPVPPRPRQRFVPSATWPEALSNGIRVIYVTGSNYLNQGSDVNRNIRAFESAELVICHELFMTPTARYADIVFPATHYLEREDVIRPEDDYLYFSAAVFPPPGRARDDYDIFLAIAERMGKGAEFSGGKTKGEWMDWIIAGSEIPADQVEGFKTSGIYDGGRHNRIGLSDFIGDPEGHPLDTPSGRIELSPAAYADTGYAAHPHFRGILEHPDLPLMLVTPHSLFRINSTGSNIPWIRDGDPVRLRIHPADALPRGIGNGDAVTVTGESGTMRITAAVTEDIMPGVVSCPQGGWLGTDPSANVVTSLEPTMPSVSTRTHTVFVEVTKIDRTEETP